MNFFRLFNFFFLRPGHPSRHFSTLNQLRDYQQECIKTCLEEFYQNGIKRQAVSLPVGSGKTIIFSNLINLMQSPKIGADKVLVLAHREELLLQAQRQIQLYNPNLYVSLEKGEFKADLEADIILASVPTLGRKKSLYTIIGDKGIKSLEPDSCCDTVNDRLSKFNPDLFKCIIIDEAHHSAAPSYRRILHHFNAFHPDSHILVWGCSGTLRRHDHLALSNLFEKVVYHRDILDLIDSGWLSKAKLKQVYTDLDVGKVDFDCDDFNKSALSLALNTPLRNDLTAKTWQKEAFLEGRKSTIVFAINIAHVYGLVESFNKIVGFQPAIITSKTDKYERAKIIFDYSSGLIPVIINCGVLTEGTDLPRTDCILMARPTCNQNLYVQMIGRGLRPAPSKSDCLILDIIDKFKSPKRSLVTFPSLLAPKATPRSSDTKNEQTPSKSPPSEINPDNITIKVLQKEWDFLSLDSIALNWVSIPRLQAHSLDCSEFRVILHHPERSSTSAYAILRRESEDGEMEEIPILDNNPILVYKSNLITIIKHVPLHSSLGAIEKFIQEYTMPDDSISDIRFLISRQAKWLQVKPPSLRQTQLLLIMAKELMATGAEIKSINGLSKGQAAAAISKWTFLKLFRDRTKMFQNLTWSDFF